MMRSEFIGKVQIRLEEKAGGPVGHPEITDETWEVIHAVYQWHPSIKDKGGKHQISILYTDFGMSVIYDMLPRAKKLEEAETELQGLLRQVELVRGRIEQLRQMLL